MYVGRVGKPALSFLLREFSVYPQARSVCIRAGGFPAGQGGFLQIVLYSGGESLGYVDLFAGRLRILFHSIWINALLLFGMPAALSGKNGNSTPAAAL